MVYVKLVIYLPENKENVQVPGWIDFRQVFNFLTWAEHFSPLTNITVQSGTFLIEICLNIILFLFHIEKGEYWYKIC